MAGVLTAREAAGGLGNGDQPSPISTARRSAAGAVAADPDRDGRRVRELDHAPGADPVGLDGDLVLGPQRAA